jgi:hypothetical protein
VHAHVAAERLPAHSTSEYERSFSSCFDLASLFCLVFFVLVLVLGFFFFFFFFLKRRLSISRRLFLFG